MTQLETELRGWLHCNIAVSSNLHNPPLSACLPTPAGHSPTAGRLHHSGSSQQARHSQVAGQLGAEQGGPAPEQCAAGQHAGRQLCQHVDLQCGRPGAVLFPGATHPAHPRLPAPLCQEPCDRCVPTSCASILRGGPHCAPCSRLLLPCACSGKSSKVLWCSSFDDVWDSSRNINVLTLPQSTRQHGASSSAQLARPSCTCLVA